MGAAVNQREHQKAVEFSCVERVAHVRGGKALREDGQWPDGWIEDQAGNVPVEVVTAFQRRRGEDPTKGAPSVVAYKRAEREATAIERETGVPVGFGTHQDQGFVVPLDGHHQMPLALEPIEPVQWILAAIRQKIGKNYSAEAKTVLVVDFRWMPLYPFELPRLAELLEEAGCRFREVWIASEFGEVQRVYS
jgi:hypothetical protein